MERIYGRINLFTLSSVLRKVGWGRFAACTVKCEPLVLKLRSDELGNYGISEGLLNRCSPMDSELIPLDNGYAIWRYFYSLKATKVLPRSICEKLSDLEISFTEEFMNYTGERTYIFVLPFKTEEEKLLFKLQNC